VNVINYEAILEIVNALEELKRMMPQNTADPRSRQQSFAPGRSKRPYRRKNAADDAGIRSISH